MTPPRTPSTTARSGTAKGDPRTPAGSAAPNGSGSRSYRDPLQQASQVELQFARQPRFVAAARAEQVQAWGQRRSGEEMPQPAPQTIAYDGRSEGASERKGHPRGSERGVEDECAPQGTGPSAPAFGRKSPEGAALSDTPGQADSLWRPLSRRALSTARPARVLIRWRKPCFLARRRLFG